MTADVPVPESHVDPSQLLTRLKAMTNGFTTTQLVSLGVTFVLVAGIVAGSALWLNAPEYTLLFADMEPDAAAQVVERLKSMKVPYTLDSGGRAVRVRSDRVDELRIELTAQGMPASGRIGFEIFDRTAFGATEFLEHVNYRRALEGEIARTISTLSEVAGARVHISMGKDTLFGERRPAKASVVLKLRSRERPLSQASVAGIANLVAGSVEGLRPEAVVVLDNFGRPLTRPEEDGDPLGAAQLERQQRLERDLAARIVALLEPVVGLNRVRVNVAAKLNGQSTEETEERWDPTSAVVRSRQTTSDIAGGAAGVPMLVAGARGNLPASGDDKAASAAPTVTANVPGSSRQAETTNYEVSRTTRHVVHPRGAVERLSVAVILDDDEKRVGKDGVSTIARVPRTREEIQKIQGIVAAAVGLDLERGDQLTVENVSFDEPLVQEPPAPTMMERFAPQIQQFGRIAAVVLIACAAFMLVIRPAMRATGLLPAQRQKGKALELAQAPSAAVQAPRTVAELESEIEAELDAAAYDKVAAWRKMPVLTRKISTITKSDPEQVARLLRSWITDEAR